MSRPRPAPLTPAAWFREQRATPASPLRDRVEADELLDADDLDPVALAANLYDIQTVNRLAGGTATVLRHLPALVCHVPRGRPVEILDLATGAGDIPRAIAAWAARNSRPLHLTVNDRSPAFLAIARETLAGVPDVTFLPGDARAMPLPDGRFDVVLCSLALHHFAPADAVLVLREMDRLARTGFIVNDIRRCASGYFAAWLASRLATRNRLTRHDMPLSVRRAYTPHELRNLLTAAAIPHAVITTHPLFRMAAVLHKGGRGVGGMNRLSPYPPTPLSPSDVIVVGGGPAGSLTALLLAERGFRVQLFDKAHFPRHKACSEYVNAAGARLLRELGFADALAASGAHHMPAMMIHAPGGTRFLAEFDRHGNGDHALGLSRQRLDALLLDHARTAGVQVHEGAHVRDLLREDGRVHGVVVTIDGQREIVRAPLTIGADGRNGVVCRALGLAVTPRWPRHTGLVAHYRGVPGLDAWGEMQVAAHGYAGLAPLEDGLTNVAFVASSQSVASRAGPLDAFFRAGLAAMPALAAKLRGAERVGAIRGVGPMAHRAHRVAGDGFLLVGDAAGFLDPFTGDGIYEALQGALLAAPIAAAALSAGDCSAARLAPYQTAHRQAFAARRQLGWLVQAFIANPALMNYATARLARRPTLAATFSASLSGLHPAEEALAPRFLAQVLRP